MRALLRRRRAELTPPERADLSERAGHRLRAGPLARAGGWFADGPIALFHALAEEIDTSSLIEALAAAGRPILLPRQQGRGRPLAFHRWQPGHPLVVGSFGVREPAPDAPSGRPTVVLVPLLAFDARGNRLGYGAGFYDRTLAALRAAGPRPLAIGFGFDLQEVDRVPVDATDERLDLVVTDARTLRMAATSAPGLAPA